MTPTHSQSIVIDAVDRFSDQYFPCGSLVSHPAFGTGRVQRREGHVREVAFSRKISKRVDEIPQNEWPDCNPLNVKAVSWIEHERHWVKASELKLLKRPAPARKMKNLAFHDLSSILKMTNQVDVEMPEMPDISGL